MKKAHWARFRVFYKGKMYYPSDDEYDKQQRIFGWCDNAPSLTMDGEARLCYVNPDGEYNRNDWSKLEDAEFMLCTGRKAELETTVYENDIVRVQHYGVGLDYKHILPKEALYEVVWDQEDACFTLYKGTEASWLRLGEEVTVAGGSSGAVTYIPYKIFVAGNRFENPELVDKFYCEEKDVGKC